MTERERTGDSFDLFDELCNEMHGELRKSDDFSECRIDMAGLLSRSDLRKGDTTVAVKLVNKRDRMDMEVKPMYVIDTAVPSERLEKRPYRDAIERTIPRYSDDFVSDLFGISHNARYLDDRSYRGYFIRGYEPDAPPDVIAFNRFSFTDIPPLASRRDVDKWRSRLVYGMECILDHLDSV